MTAKRSFTRMRKQQSSAKRDNTSIAPASDVPLGELALFILDQSRRHGGDGCCFVCADESQAERLGAVIHAVDSSSGVMVLPSLIASPDMISSHPVRLPDGGRRCYGGWPMTGTGC
jgi:hypothetical protein